MINRISENIANAIVGKESVIEMVLVALLSQGHVLIEDVPGVGKTTLAKALAKTLDLKFSRIQFTPDLLPSDVLGVSIYNQNTREFEMKHGPIRCNILLADEINRASPKTQSSLLEAMAERQYTLEGNTYELGKPFMVIATQNPVEFEGTFPLPEAQLDRFMMRIAMGYPRRDKEIAILEMQSSSAHLSVVANGEDLDELIEKGKQIEVSQNIKKFIVDIVGRTRTSQEVLLPASPRASQDLYKASKCLAMIRGREYVIPEDVVYLAPHIISHRIILNPEVKYRGLSESDLIDGIARSVKVEIDEKR
jgi:MoxR-like ATPase